MEGTYIKRFCFAEVNRALNNVGFDFLESGKLKKKDALAIAGLENFEIFQIGSYKFSILDLISPFSLEQFEHYLKTSKARDTDSMLALIANEKNHCLNSIFKKKSGGNNLVKKNKEYLRTVMTLEIKNDPELLKAYIEIHKPNKIWPEVLDNMDVMGILDMEIYLWGYQAFMIMDTPTDFDMGQEGERWSKLPHEREWQHYVAKFQKIDPESKAVEKWKVMELKYRR